MNDLMFIFQYDAEVSAIMENISTFTLATEGTLATTIVTWKNRMSLYR
jgi:hypothetical protein